MSGANTAVTDSLIGGRLSLNSRIFLPPNREFDGHGFAAIDFEMRKILPRCLTRPCRERSSSWSLA
jgi:hypothetical protein